VCVMHTSWFALLYREGGQFCYVDFVMFCLARLVTLRETR